MPISLDASERSDFENSFGYFLSIFLQIEASLCLIVRAICVNRRKLENVQTNKETIMVKLLFGSLH